VSGARATTAAQIVLPWLAPVDVHVMDFAERAVGDALAGRMRRTRDV